ncbi:MAG: phytanoyl-CoA dioxygenase family protein [Deltaproteobacteria bacterium]|nr:phytanoyl-CoA dioxygenase family protein [Deltaproteobacteria bacterium]
MEPLTDAFIEEALEHFHRDGWAFVGNLCDAATLDALRARADAIMLGEVTYDGLFFQHDAPSGDYDDLEYGKGYQGPSLEYRKVEKLEKDPLYWDWMRREPFGRIATRVYGTSDVSLYRAFLMNKHAGGGSNLPWHQDGGSFWGLDRDPILQIWTALDDAPLDGGCLEFVRGSHLDGLATPLGGVVPEDKLRKMRNEEVTRVTAVAGDVILIHNHVWHRSGRTFTGKPRRALSVCYMHGATQCRRKKRSPRTFVRVFGA